MKKIALVAGLITAALMLAGLVKWADAAWVVPALVALYLVQPIRDPALASRAQVINNSIVGTVLAVAVCVGIYLHAWPKPSAYRSSLEAIHAELSAADQTGDAARAVGQFDAVTAILRKLNDDPMAQHVGPVRSCLLAAAQVTHGIDVVSKGGRWLDRQRFDAAFKDCA